MTSGPANGQSQTITANTAKKVTVGVAFSPAPTPGGGDDFTITHVGDDRATWCQDTLDLLGAASPPEHLATHFFLPLQEGAGKATPIAPATVNPAQSCNDGVNNDGDGGSDATEPDGADIGTEPDCDGTGDIDGDGYSDDAELKMGTSPMYDCGPGGWPPNVYEKDNVIDISDIGAVVNAGLFKSSVGRWRANVFPDAAIDISDIGAVVNAGLFTSWCTP